MECRVCRQQGFTPLWTVKGFDWVRCQHCGSFQTTRTLTGEELAQYYNDDYYTGYKKEAHRGVYVDYIGQRAYIQRNLDQRLDWVMRYLEPGYRGDWLDVGCAAGFLLDTARNHGFTPWGIDYAEFGPEYARTQLNMPGVRQATLDSLPDDFPEKFNVISMIDVLEHVTHQHDTLTRCANLLNPGGYLIGETFDPASLIARMTGAAWHAIDPPNHFAILSLPGIEQLMRENGLQLVKSARLPRWLSLATIASKFSSTIAKRTYQMGLNRLGIPIWLNDVVIWMYQKQ